MDANDNRFLFGEVEIEKSSQSEEQVETDNGTQVKEEPEDDAE